MFEQVDEASLLIDQGLNITGYFGYTRDLNQKYLPDLLDESLKQMILPELLHGLTGEPGQKTIEILSDQTSTRFEISFTPIMGANHEVSLVSLSIHRKKQTGNSPQNIYGQSFEHILAQLSLDLLQLDHNNYDAGLNLALKTLGQATMVDRSYIFLLSPNKKYACNKYEWHSPLVSSQKQHLQKVDLLELEWMINKFATENPVHISSVESLNGSSMAFKKHLTKQEIKSLVVVPLYHHDELIGFLGLDAVLKRKWWSKEETDLLQLMAELIVNKIHQLSLENEINFNQKEYQQLFDNAHDAILVFDPKEERILNANIRASEIYGYSQDELYGKSLIEMTKSVNQGKDYIHQLKKLKRIHLESIQIHKEGYEMLMDINASWIKYKGKDAVLSINRDKTKDKQAALDLQESQTRYRLLFENINLGIFVLERKGSEICCKDMNHNVEKLLGIKKINALTKPILELIPQLLQTGMYENIQQVFETGNSVSLSSSIKINGRERHIASHTYKISTNECVFIFNDVTHRQLIERALLESQKRYKTLFNNSSDAIFIHDLEGKFMNINRIATKRLGYTRKELIKMKPSDLDTSEFRKMIKARFQSLKENGKIIFETAHVKKDGKVIPVEINSRLIKYDNKIAVLSTARDITERKLTDQKLNWELNINKALSDISGQILKKNFLLDEISETILSYARQLTQSEHGLVSEIEPVTGQNTCSWATHMMEACRLGDIQKFELANCHSGENQGLWDFTLNQHQPFFSNDPMHHPFSQGIPSGHIDIKNFLNIPALLDKQLLGQIALANSARGYSQKDVDAIQRLAQLYALAIYKKRSDEELKTRNTELNNFVYKVSHDLRAPLASILGILNISKISPDEEKDYLFGLVENRVIKLDGFIRDILSHSRNLNTPVKINKIDLDQVLNKVFSELHYLNTHEKIAYKWHISSQDFYSDQVRIYEIFRNLISNSIKYTNPYQDKNLIDISIKITPPKVDILIIDQGMGIKKEHLPHIFEMFYKGTEKSESSGIGLYIVKQAVEKLGGKISVESQYGKGSSFWLQLPNHKKLFTE